MNIAEELLKKNTPHQSLKIAEYIDNDSNKFRELLDLFLNGSNRISQTAAGVLNRCVINHPDLISPHLEFLLENLKQSVSHAIVRNLLRCFQFITIPEEHQGTCTELCFTFLSGRYPVAIKVFAMTVLYNIAVNYPELLEEVKLVVEAQMPYGSAGFKSRGSKILQKIKKENRILG